MSVLFIYGYVIIKKKSNRGMVLLYTRVMSTHVCLFLRPFVEKVGKEDFLAF